MTKLAGHTHPGRCTTEPLFTKQDAHETLEAMGYTFDTEQYVWVSAAGVVGGRLEWTPNFCDDSNPSVGYGFQLRSPNGYITSVPIFNGATA